MKVKFTLLFLLVVFAHAAFSQSFVNPAVGVASPKKTVQEIHKPFKHASAKQMEAVAEAMNGYVSGQTHNIYFRLDITNTDAEYGDSLSLTFPEGITVNSVSNDENFGPVSFGDAEAYNGIDGQTVSWGDNDNSFGGIAASSVYTFSANLTFDAALSGDQTIDGFLSGDEFGSNSGDLNFTITLSEASSPTSRIQIIHNVADPSAATVDIRVNGAFINPSLDDLDFRTASPFIQLTSLIPFEFSVNDASSSDASSALMTQTISLDPGISYVIVLDGTASSTGFDPASPLSFELLPQAMEAAASSDEVVAAIHNGSTDAPIIDLMEAGGYMPIANDLAYTEFSDYSTFPLSDYMLSLLLDDGTTLIHSYQVNFETEGLGGQAFTILTSGFMNPADNSDGPAMGLWAAPASGGALIAFPEFVVENDSPCDAVPILTDGTVVDGSNVGATVDPDEIAPPNGDCSGNMSWCDGIGDFGQLDGTVWYSFTAPESGGVELTSCNANTDFDTQIAVYAADDCADYSTFTLIVANDDFDISGNCDAQSFYASRVSACGLLPGNTYYVQVDGYGGGVGALSLSMVPLEAASCMAKVQFVNNSADPMLQNVDIRVNGELMAGDYDNLEFRYATAVMELPAGTPLAVTVNDASSTDDSDPFYTEDNLVLIPGEYYVIAIQGLVSESGFSPGADIASLNLNIISGALETNPSPNNTYLAFVNGVTDSPAIDIKKQYNGAGTLTTSLAYNDIDGYVDESTINTTWAVYENGSSDIYGSFNASLSDFGFGGKVATVFASGFYDPSQNSDGAAFGLFASTPEGGMLISFDNATAVANIDALGSFVVYPNPSDAYFNIDFELTNAQTVVVLLINLLGQKVKEMNLGMRSSGFNTTTITTDGMSPGFYLMDITIGGSHTTTKVQVIR